MRHDDYVDADEMLRRKAAQDAERERRWERIWQAAAAIHAAAYGNPKMGAVVKYSVDEAEALVREWEKRRMQSEAMANDKRNA